MALLLGLMIPVILAGRQYRKANHAADRLVLAKFETSLAEYSVYIFLFVLITGIVRTIEVGFPWFSFRLLFWLAVKQSIGMLLLIWAGYYLYRVRSVKKQLKTVPAEEDELRRHFEIFEDSVHGQLHLLIGSGWLLAILGIWKIAY